MIPIIDFHSKTVEQQMYVAYTTCGFAVFTNVYDEWLLEFRDWRHLMEEFFNLPVDIKQQYAYSGVTENIGYNWLEEERLTPTMPGDLKESYNWVSPDRMQEQYWPTEIPDFKPMAQKIERISRMLSYQFLYRFEKVLRLPTGSLVEKHIDGSATMRIIHYPAWDGEIKEGQVRGGAHTDYGSITLLWRFDDVGGLQIQDRETNYWVDVPVVENSIVLNIADMFARWSNDTLKSSNHRIVNTDLTRPRYSMPYFVDPGRDVMIENLTNKPDKYPPISAYEYLKWRLAQSYDDDDYVENEQVMEDQRKK
jgi:isopenicillin N synthase-like dioxygenase|tara:strand:- start:467 stop:1390 length:924 start_codon:yes stop_codon:yes gene_type:complete